MVWYERAVNHPSTGSAMRTASGCSAYNEDDVCATAAVRGMALPDRIGGNRRMAGMTRCGVTLNRVCLDPR